MNKIMEKTYELIDVLDKSDMIRDMGIYRDRIMRNQELSNLIRKANELDDEYAVLDIKKKLYDYEEYRGYMDNYNQVMYLVMDINSRYQGLVGQKGCHK